LKNDENEIVNELTADNEEDIIFKIIIIYEKIINNLGIGDWGLGIGDWGLGIGDWAQSPIPNPQSPFFNR